MQWNRYVRRKMKVVGGRRWRFTVLFIVGLASLIFMSIMTTIDANE